MPKRAILRPRLTVGGDSLHEASHQIAQSSHLPMTPSGISAVGGPPTPARGATRGGRVVRRDEPASTGTAGEQGPEAAGRAETAAAQEDRHTSDPGQRVWKRSLPAESGPSLSGRSPRLQGEATAEQPSSPAVAQQPAAQAAADSARRTRRPVLLPNSHCCPSGFAVCPKLAGEHTGGGFGSAADDGADMRNRRRPHKPSVSPEPAPMPEPAAKPQPTEPKQKVDDSWHEPEDVDRESERIGRQSGGQVGGGGLAAACGAEARHCRRLGRGDGDSRSTR